jgi:hypothetical protein
MSEVRQHSKVLIVNGVGDITRMHGLLGAGVMAPDYVTMCWSSLGLALVAMHSCITAAVCLVMWTISCAPVVNYGT